ncbi:craniofacial development protein 2-like [Eupeodes corollae]|uniref:craniofacial development protein 2-like n=1 Tax=Eupeodes corollae TaxID=290404 RepID=UPI00248FB7FD|nr:craniofacial development protein 2-like [Eupeodes corollae]
MREIPASDNEPPLMVIRLGTTTDYALRFCTWNVMLYTPGATQKLESVHIFLYCIYLDADTSWEIGLDRTSWISKQYINATLQKISIICAHAPTDDAEESNKEDFYDLLNRAHGACPEYEVKIVLGDFNAKIGKEDIFGGLVGKQSLHEETTDNGFRLIDFAAARNTVISSTRFPRRKIYTATWRSPDGRTTNEIDHVLIGTRQASNILNVRTFRGANVNSDHFLVVLSSELEYQTKKNTCGPKKEVQHRLP